MAKAVAIPYVIALILGVIVIAILVYWFINQAGKTTTVGTSAECQAKEFSYCVQWQNNDKDCDDTKNPTKIPSTTISGCDLKGDKPQKSDCEKIGLCK